MCLERIFSLVDVNRCVSVDDMGIFRIQPKLPQQHPADRLGALVFVVWVLRLLPGGFVLDEGAFKGFDYPARQRRIAAAPQIPHEIQITLRRVLVEERPTGSHIRIIHVASALINPSLQMDGFERSVLIQRHTAVEQQVAVEHLIHTAVAVQKFDMAL